MPTWLAIASLSAALLTGACRNQERAAPSEVAPARAEAEKETPRTGAPRPEVPLPAEPRGEEPRGEEPRAEEPRAEAEKPEPAKPRSEPGAPTTAEECTTAGGAIAPSIGSKPSCPAGKRSIGAIRYGIEGALCCK